MVRVRATRLSTKRVSNGRLPIFFWIFSALALSGKGLKETAISFHECAVFPVIPDNFFLKEV